MSTGHTAHEILGNGTLLKGNVHDYSKAADRSIRYREDCFEERGSR